MSPSPDIKSRTGISIRQLAKVNCTDLHGHVGHPGGGAADRLPAVAPGQELRREVILHLDNKTGNPGLQYNMQYLGYVWCVLDDRHGPLVAGQDGPAVELCPLPAGHAPGPDQGAVLHPRAGLGRAGWR